MNQHQVYFDYLKQRSFVGKYYRNFWLYPKITKLLQGRVLDVGCGVGDMLVFRPNSIGVDINPFNVNFCLSRGCDARLMQNNILPFEDNSFDSVLLDNVLEHIEDPAPLLSEIGRVLKSRGVLLIGVPGRRGYACDPDHKIFYDENLLIELAKDNHFIVKNTVYLPLWRSSFFDKYLKQYCIYAKWVANN